MRNANYKLVEQTTNHIIIRDLGPWDAFMSVTNAAEQVVGELLAKLNGRKLYYYDSDGSLDELLIKDNKFGGFRSGGPPQ
jgi:hypothetical protein